MSNHASRPRVNADQELPKYVGIPEAGRLVGLSAGSIRRALSRNELTKFKPLKRTLLEREQVLAWIASKRV